MARKYLQYFPKPVLDDLISGRWLPIVGAGMSLNAHVPSGARLPLWGELGKRLGDDLSDYNGSGALDTISAYEHEFGRARLVDRLSELLLVHEAQPGEAHQKFCSIPFDIVCTTNFDFLLEHQYRLAPRLVYPVLEEEQLSLNAPKAGTMLLKLHGDLHHPNRMIVTETDYDGFLSNYPLIATYLSNLLITKTAVLIGYSLDDPDFRQIWHVVSQRLGRTRKMAYSMMVDGKPSDIARYERRGVKVINLPGSRDRYGEVLSEAFAELREYVLDNVLSASKVTEEMPLREISLPRSTSSRLCFLSVQLELLPFYKERVFPLLEDHGLVPVTADDVISPGDNVSAKIAALIDRSAVMVVELSSSWTYAELRMAIARLRGNGKPIELIIIAKADQPVPPEAIELPIIRRHDAWLVEPDQFLQELEARLSRTVLNNDHSRTGEAARLLKAKEYRAAVIAALTDLETFLRMKVKTSGDTKRRTSIALSVLIDIAVEERMMPLSSREQVLRWARIRNTAVHTQDAVAPKIAREIVQGVSRLIEDMKGEL